MSLTREQLEAAAADVCAGEVEALTDADVLRAVTIGQYLFDRALAEIERRGMLEWHEGEPAVPYDSDHAVENVLTRPLN